MPSKLIKIALVGKTNSGKSTFINSMVGEKISISDQIITYEYCYPNDSLLNTFFSFSKHSGKVFMIEMSTSW